MPYLTPGDGMRQYGLDGQPISMAEASELFASPERLTARTIITTDRGQVLISTVFLVFDHGWSCGPPVLWETMVFGGPDTDQQYRYSSLAEALAGHDDAVVLSRAALDIDGAVIIAEERADARPVNETRVTADLAPTLDDSGTLGNPPAR